MSYTIKKFITTEKHDGDYGCEYGYEEKIEIDGKKLRSICAKIANNIYFEGKANEEHLASFISDFELEADFLESFNNDIVSYVW